MNDEIPESFLKGMSDIEEGRVYPMEVVMSYKSEDYNEGYRDGFNQCLKEHSEKHRALEKLIAAIKPWNIHPETKL